MSTDAVTSFITQLRKTSLLDAAQQEEAERLGQMVTQTGKLAGELVRRGWITTFQANQVARGRAAELVLGSYIVLEPLARGGMGQVFKARHRYLQRNVALKLIRPDQRDSPDTVERFRREVQLLANLRHPHIVQAHDAGNIGDIWFLAMELLEGTNLEQLVARCGPLPISQACVYLRQAALGLQYAHERGLVHRDIKPSNLFLTGEGVKLLDLGLARPQVVNDEGQAGNLTRANTVMGTPDYLAPEQALDPRRANARSDLYSLGCTLYFLLTGRPPFPDGTLAQKLLHHQQTAPRPVESVRPEVPPALAELLRRLLAKAPEQRPASAAEAAAQLVPLTAVPAGGATAVPAPSAASNPPRAIPLSSNSPASPSSLVDSRPAAPEHGFTLVAESLPPTAAPPLDSSAPTPSLIDSSAPTPEHGFTLTAESLPPTAAPSLEQPASASYERGWTLTTESLPPTVAPPPLTEPAPIPPNRRLVIGLSIGGGVLALLLLIGGIMLVRGLLSSETKQSPGDAPLAEGSILPPDPNEPPKAKDEPPAPTPPKEKKPKPNSERPQFLAPLGPEEAADFFEPPFPVDPYLVKLATYPHSPGADHKVFLGDLEEFAYKSSHFWWTFGKSGRLGDKAAQNKKLIQVNNTLYPNGLGMHPPDTGFTRVCYAPGKRAKSLHGAVAINDHTEFLIPQPTRFVILSNGRIIWRSEAIRDRGVVEKFELDVSETNILELRVYTESSGSNGSHAVWLDPYLIVEPNPSAVLPPKDQKLPPAKVEALAILEPGLKEKPDMPVKPFAVDPRLLQPAPFEQVFLSDLQEFGHKGSPPDWKFAKNGRMGDPNHYLIRLNGELHLKGLGTAPPHGTYTRVCYALGKKAKSLHGAVAFGDDKTFWKPKPTRFVIIADGQVRWRSNAISERGVSETFHLDVRDVDILELRVYAEHPSSTGCNAVWIDPYVLKE